MTTKHTPGPWRKFLDPQRDLGQVIWDPTNNQGPALIITAGVSGRTKEEALANLNLFHAAPDLLKMCEEMCAYLRAADIVRAGHATKGSPARISRPAIEAVIAKARGE